MQLGIRGLVAVELELGSCLLEMRSRGVVAPLAPIVFGGTDEALREEFAVTDEVGLGLFEVRARRHQLLARGFGAEALILRIELCEYLPFRHACADIDQARNDFARHAKAKCTLPT